MFWYVKLNLFSLDCDEVSRSEFWGDYGFSMALGSLHFNVQGVFLLCWRIFMLCITLDLVGSWVELGFTVGVETFAAAATLLQSCPTLCDPVDGSPPGSPIPGILQARTPEWVAISLSNS